MNQALIAELREANRQRMAALRQVEIGIARVLQDRRQQAIDAVAFAAHRLAVARGAKSAADALATPAELSRLRSSFYLQKGAEHRQHLAKLRESGELDQIRAERANWQPLLKREYQPKHEPEPADLSSLLKRAGSTFARGELRPFVDSDGELKSLAVLSRKDDTSFDEATLSARFCISTVNPDRVGDTVRPRGLDFTDYAKNAVVLWNHGQAKEIALPIGTSTDSSGKLAVEVTDTAVYARVWFGKGYGPAEDIAKLVSQGIIRAASIHMIAPIRATERKGARRGGRPALDILSAGIGEWSLVDLPCNAEATRKAADTGRLCGEPLCGEVHAVLKSMVRALPAARLLGKGWSPEVDE